jgi:predicted dienelactone hydrolase
MAAGQNSTFCDSEITFNRAALSLRPTLALVLTSLTAAWFAASQPKAEKAALHPVGLRFVQFPTPKDYNWRDSPSPALSGVVWYPAASGAEEKDQYIGPQDKPLFYAGRVAQDGKLALASSKYPLIALSHGTGGSALQMAWLGTYLAARGYMVAAVNHPGNNAVTGYTTEGFIEGWERAKDIGTVISDMLADPRFGSAIDPHRIGAAGFSYGGYTMLELAGARTGWQRLWAWCKASQGTCDPPEMPNLVAKFSAIEHQPVVQASLKHAGDSYRDPRLRAVFAIAPAVAAAFSAESLAKIDIPVEIVAGSADLIAPPQQNAEFFAAHIKGAVLAILPGGVGHYTFLDLGTSAGKKQLPQLFVDNPGVNREAVHKQVANMAAEYFDKQLAPAKERP